MSEDIKKPISLGHDSTQTPITNQPIQKTNMKNWEDMGIEALYDQLTTLENRRNMAFQMKRPEMAKQIQLGIDHLRSIIDRKQQIY